MGQRQPPRCPTPPTPPPLGPPDGKLRRGGNLTGSYRMDRPKSPTASMRSHLLDCGRKAFRCTPYHNSAAGHPALETNIADVV